MGYSKPSPYVPVIIGGGAEDLDVGLGEPAHIVVERPRPPHVLLLVYRDHVALVEGEVVLLLGPPRVQGLRLEPLLHRLTLRGNSIESLKWRYYIRVPTDLTEYFSMTFP